jgi:hypothetical protein
MSDDYQGQTRYDDDDGQIGDGLLRIQWLNGKPQMESGGRFYVSNENLAYQFNGTDHEGFVPNAPWVPKTVVFQDGRRGEGYVCDTLRAAVICVRQQPFHWNGPMGTDGRKKIWQAKWEKDPTPEFQSMQTDLLMYAEGFEAVGQPVVLGVSTIKISFGINSWGKSGLIKDIRDWMSDPASKEATARARQKDPKAEEVFMDTYAFWATIGTKRDGKGQVVYETTKGQAVTLPVLQRPAGAAPDMKWIRSQYIGVGNEGKALLAWLEQTRADYDAWKKERKGNEQQPIAAQGGRNIPAEYDEDEEPPF